MPASIAYSKEKMTASDFKQFIHNTLPNGGIMFDNTGRLLDGSIGKYFTLIIRHNDHIVNLIGKDPIIEVVPFIIKLHIADRVICYFFLLIRCNQNSALLYEASFNLADNFAFNMLETITQQEKQQIFVTGETQDSTIIVDLSMPYFQIASMLKVVKKHPIYIGAMMSIKNVFLSFMTNLTVH